MLFLFLSLYYLCFTGLRICHTKIKCHKATTAIVISESISVGEILHDTVEPRRIFLCIFKALRKMTQVAQYAGVSGLRFARSLNATSIAKKASRLM